MEDFVPKRKKPIAFLPSFLDRSIIKGEGLFRFSAQVVVLLGVGLMVLAFLAAMGIETPASDSLASFFVLIVGVWNIGVLVWVLFGPLVWRLSGPAQFPLESENVEDTIEDKLLSPDSLSIRAESGRGVQRSPESPADDKKSFDPQPIEK